MVINKETLVFLCWGEKYFWLAGPPTESLIWEENVCQALALTKCWYGLIWVWEQVYIPYPFSLQKA